LKKKFTSTELNTGSMTQTTTPSKQSEMMKSKEWPNSTNPFKKNPPENTVGIVIPVRSNIKFTRLCFYSIRYFTDVPYMLVFVNNQSNLQTKRALIGISKNHQVWLLDNHVEYNKGMLLNFGLEFLFRFKNVRYGCVMDNDMVVSPGWLKKMLDNLDLGRIGPVGPQFNTAFNGLSGSCMLFRREMYEELGGFSEDFVGGGYEDYDFILRAKEKGWTPVADERIQYHHFRGMTRQFQKNGVKFQNENRKRFQLKHPVKEVANESLKVG